MAKNQNTTPEPQAPETATGADTLNPPAAPETQPDAPQKPAVSGAAAGIAKRLTQAQTGAQSDPDAPQAAAPAPFDITKLSAEQLQSLKAMLNATPDRAMAKAKNPVVLLRRIGGKIVVDFKNAYLALVFNAERRGDVEEHKIPVLFHGEKEYTDILYRDFMQADQVRTEIIGTRTEETPVVEGEVVSKETGRLTEMVVKVPSYFFTVKLPDMEPFELEAKVVNA
jgi:hypothetical protein